MEVTLLWNTVVTGQGIGKKNVFLLRAKAAISSMYSALASVSLTFSVSIVIGFPFFASFAAKTTHFLDRIYRIDRIKSVGIAINSVFVLVLKRSRAKMTMNGHCRSDDFITNLINIHNLVNPVNPV